MSRHVHTGDTEAREPLLTGDYLETHEPNSDEGRELCTSGYIPLIYCSISICLAIPNRHSELKNTLQKSARFVDTVVERNRVHLLKHCAVFEVLVLYLSVSHHICYHSITADKRGEDDRTVFCRLPYAGSRKQKWPEMEILN